MSTYIIHSCTGAQVRLYWLKVRVKLNVKLKANDTCHCYAISLLVAMAYTPQQYACMHAAVAKFSPCILQDVLHVHPNAAVA